jgi:hypothetical protein
VQSLYSATGLLIVPSVRSTCKLLLTVFTMKWFSVSQNVLDKQQNVTTLRTLFPSNVSKTGKVTAYTKLVRWNFLESGSKKKIWKTDGPEVITCLRRIRLLAKSAYDIRHVRPSFCLPLWTRLPLEAFPWKFILKSFVKICRESRNLIAVRQNYREIAVKAPSWSAMVSGY